MKSSTLLSLLVAVILGLVAVVGARSWMAQQTAALLVTGNQPAEAVTTIVVAREPLRFGERVSADKLKEIPWASPTLPAGAFSKVAELGGETEETARFVLSTIEKDEPVLASRVTLPGQRAKLSTAIAPTMKAVSIRVNDVAGVAGFVLPGDRVDVLLTRRPDNADEDAFVDVLLQGVRVLAIDQIADDRKDQPSVVRTVTFEVSTDEAQKLILASSVGTLSLALRNVVSADIEASTRVTVADIGKGATSSALEAELRQREAELAAKQAEQQAQTARLSALEETVKSLGSDVSGKFESLEMDLARRSETPVVIEAPVAPPPAPVVEAPVELVPVTVGVIRNGKREVYVVSGESR